MSRPAPTTGIIRWTVRLVLIVMLVFGGLVALTGWSFGTLPTGFCTDRRPGLPVRRCPIARRRVQTTDQQVMEKLDKICGETEGVADLYFSDRLFDAQRQCRIQRWLLRGDLRALGRSNDART